LKYIYATLVRPLRWRAKAGHEVDASIKDPAMVHVSMESPEETKARLLQVLKEADLQWYPGTFAFGEHEGGAIPRDVGSEVLALIRDGDKWCDLRPSSDDNLELFSIFSFHFSDLDNSGFVGWLAGLLKAELGTGVLVICGYNSERGGIFDYWGVPSSLRQEAFSLLTRLRQAGT
jgi:hypothetical protein